MRLLLTFCLFTLLLAYGSPLHAQELRATVTVNAPQLQIIDPQVIKEFENVVREFLNQTQFTEERYEEEERIECNFTFTLNREVNERVFEVDLLVQSSRPVFGSDYKTTLINFSDQSTVIEYEQYQPLDYSEQSYTTSLVALLAFHAHLIIGTDKDSFAPSGGTNIYGAAERIVATLPNNVTNLDPGWTTNRQRSRFNLLREYQNPRARVYRQLLYDYHRRGLDVMGTDPIAGRTVMARSLDGLEKVRSDIPNSLLLSVFSSSKTEELLSVFAPAPPAERQKVYAVMTSIDPINVTKLRAIR